MEALIEFIFSNFIIILIILGGIAKLFGYDKKEEEQKRKTSKKRKTITNKQQVPKTTSQTRETHRQTKPGSNTSPSSIPTSTASIGEQQQKQLEQLAGKMKAVGDQTFEELSEKVPVDRDVEHHAIPHHKMKLNERNFVHNKNKTEVKRQMKKRITKNGLAESIIMAEILGPPRARKPYKSIITERYR